MTAFSPVFELSSIDGSNGTRTYIWTTYDDGHSGSVVAGVGDMNGDGFDDVVIGTPWGEGWSQYTSGSVASFMGDHGPFPAYGYGSPSFIGKYEEDFGRRIEGLGDINGDGFADLVIEGSGSYYFIDVGAIDYHWESSPRSYIVFGHGTHWAREASSDFAGFTAVGDVNGDGFDDVAIGPGLVVFGAADGLPSDAELASIDASSGVHLTGATLAATSAAGDANGDGIDDLLIRSAAGDAYVVFGKAGGLGGTVDVSTLDGTDGFKFDAASAIASVSGAGDVNGDGLDDIAVGVTSGGSPGVYIVFSPASGVASVDPTALVGTNGFFVSGGGTSGTAAGDINGDTLADIIIGQHYIVFGQADGTLASLDVSALDGGDGFRIDGGTFSTGGWNIHAAGDFNGDGFDDLAIGTPDAGLPDDAGNHVGATHVVFGHAGDAQNWLGTAADEVHFGSALADVLNGAGGKDTLRGAGGDDLLIGGAGGDILDGGEGSDTVAFGTTPNSIIADLAAGTSSGHALGNDTLISIESIIGGSGADDLSGTDGANRIDGGAGADRMVGRGGDDTYVVDDAGDVIVEARNAGHDTVLASISGIVLGADIEDLNFIGTGDFTATGNTLGNVITGGAGNDTLNGGRGVDTLRGGLGNDTYLVDHPGDIVDEGDGGGFDTVETALNTTLGADIEGLVLRGTAALSGTGNALANVLTGNGAANTLLGLEGDDQLFGKAGNDKLLGAEGADLLDGGAGDDNMRGGLGDDIYVVDTTGDVASEAYGDGIDEVRTSVSFTLGSGIEKLIITTSLAVDGTGNSLANTITGGAGANVLSGLGGDDLLIGGSGGDTLDGGTGSDVMKGGFGNDIYVVDRATDVVDETGGSGTDTVVLMTAGPHTLVDGVENIVLAGASGGKAIGNSLNNAMTGTASADRFEGLGGADTFSGGDGGDTFVYGALGFGKDTVTDFTAGVAGDILSFDTGIFADFADALAHATTSGFDVVIAYDGVNKITLQNVALGDLTAGNFDFV